ncbi:stage II sporulation protein P [Salipaludibacillus agaradhaerens]|uniref:stage II sporulation protein P n=2 Tax=Salipaludibacillus agaradhaerens TaxID=76935 RepID=UPI002151260A|nr:stage II sporulation protein P [Salipaludibacillus agaradhaerens]MCR6106294.1 stage II sporulation protein P [Salipaludibacillus agaradhaerens]MCR6118327.1 stage II sporulation protein P [Salipaludibacillus agaradhaerens]
MKKHTYIKRSRPIYRNRTSISTKKLMLVALTGTFIIFFVAATLTSFGAGYHLTSASVNNISNNLSVETLVYVLGNENRYFKQSLPEGNEPFSVTPLMLQLTTNINTEDPRSLLGRELPGFSLFDGRILTAGEGVDYTSMPIESAPPMEVLLAEREASTERLEEIADLKESVAETDNLDDLPVTVHIIHTHNRESYLPELQNTSDPFHESVNITLAGERLGIELAKHGIRAEVDTTDIGAELNERSWRFSQSYEVSREIMEEAKQENEEIQFYFDLHRDSQPRENTTVELNGETYAQALFVIGENNPDYEKNKVLANKLHERLQEDYYGLSRGIFAPPVSEGSRNGVYNQDLSENALLVEFGGIENSLEEVYRTVEAFAEVFSDFYWEQQDKE